jgi:DNA-binding Lrp family transcriptional regulator
MSDADFSLLNRFQRDFPLTPEPFRVIAAQLGWTEAEVLAALRRLQQDGKVSRVGAVFAANKLGVSTLAALAVPVVRLETVAGWVNEYPEVNHNYQREHEFNLWFVLTAPSPARLQAVLAEIRDRTGLPLLDLPLLEPFHIDLGFDLYHGRRDSVSADATASTTITPVSLSTADRHLLAALQPGLPLVSRPYQALGQTLGWSEQAVMYGLRAWLKQGIIKRIGVIVRHRELGYRANAMTVWDIPDAEISAVGRALAAEPGVNLCYRRLRCLPHWPYNLFCMVHGQERAEVLERIDGLRQRQQLTTYPHAVLFSTRCFRQRGAYYLPSALPSVRATSQSQNSSPFEALAWMN